MAASESQRVVASVLFRPSIVTPAVNTFGNYGVRNIARIAGVLAGGWVFELEDGQPLIRMNARVQPYGSAQFTPAVVQEVGSTRVEVRTFNAAGALADCDFFFEVTQAAAALREDQRFA